MDQRKTGEFLKQLRKERGLTQEVLAERFYVSNRTVSRWETGASMPDVGMLIELADFYDVDIREIIDGERKGEIMDREVKETLKKVAAYATEGERRSQSKYLLCGFWVCVVLLVTTVLFGGEFNGLLYGVLPEDICTLILGTVYMAAGGFIIAFLRVIWFAEKPATEAKKTVAATMDSKEVVEGTHRSGRSMMGYSFVVRFRLEDGQILELYAYEVEFGALKPGMTGNLTYQGRYFVCFEE